MGMCMSRGQPEIVSWTGKIQFGDITLKNRVFMAAMSRVRCDPKDGVPTDLVVKYYGQRAGAGLIFTQCSAWSQRGVAYPGAGDIYTKAQADGWKKVVDQVHKKGGKIAIQLFHAGRATAPAINNGLEAWAPSAIAVREDTNHNLGGKNFPVPKEMTIEDIQTTKKQFQESVKLAKGAGFDGIEISSGNGFLPDQFIRSSTNKRKDIYGGSVENRCRFILQLVDLAAKHFKSHQIGLKLTPVGRLNDISDENPVETYNYLLRQLSSKNVGFVQLYESVDKEWGVKSLDLHVPAKKQIEDVCQTFRAAFTGLIIANNGFNAETGLEKLRSKNCDAVSFAKLYITNPDLAQRIIAGAPLDTKLDFGTLYGAGLPDKAKGYTEYEPYKKQ